MDNLIKESLSSSEQIVSNITLLQVFFCLSFSLICNSILAVAYKYFNENYAHSKSVTITILLVGLIITLIMIIIGSNIARAFALVGAMSIVRFRNPIKDPRDLSFIFAAIAVGMGSGTFFYLFTLVFVFFFLGTCILIKKINLIFKKELLKIMRFDYQEKNKDLVNKILEQYIKEKNLISTNSYSYDESLFVNQIYEIKFKNISNFQECINEFNKNVNLAKIQILSSDSDSGI